MVTNQCPLQCAHCGPRSGPWAKGSADIEMVTAALDEAQARRCQIVNFTGGEPFILGNKLAEMVQAATDRGLFTRVTTGAYWSRTPKAAERSLQPLQAAGLRQLFISCSDQHREFVPMQNVLEATRAARNYKIDVYLALGTSKTSRTSFRSVTEAFIAAGEDVPFMADSPLIPFGRAQENISPDSLHLQPVGNFAGPCSSMAEHPTIRATGRVTGCAVTFGDECSALSFGDISRESLSDAIDRMDSSPLAAWIHNVGVVELKNLIEANSSLRFADHYVNICHLCGEILGNPDSLAVLEDLGLYKSTQFGNAQS
jgi:organic radical activating enzyme